MGFGDDEDILQDFLVEAGEILEQLSEQLVDMEQRPDDTNLLNAIFRGFHTVKGGAGFLQLTPMVECCHITENLFDILRNGKAQVTPELMDVVLEALDAVNTQFAQLSQRQALTPASPALLAALERLVAGEPAQSSAPVRDSSEPVATPEGDITDAEFEQLLDAIAEPPVADRSDASPEPLSDSADTGSDEITDDEFEALLDQLHGKGKAPTRLAQAPLSSVNSDLGSDEEINYDEFEALLDELHGKGRAPGKKSAPAPDAPPAAPGEPKLNKSAQPDLITDDEFEALLDELHGKGRAPTAAKPSSKAKASPVTKSAPASKSTSKSPSPTPAAAPPAVPKAEAAKQSGAEATAAITKAEANGVTAKAPEREVPATVETTVRVDTQRLDEIMNMVGELVLVRNRLVRLGVSAQDEALSKAVANLDVVTADLQSSVMKTRMQPIRKVFGRFPRVVRDLARSLNKDINLELVGEETDLDKNLVEALADPLVHLVRNAVDHGIELPEVREAKGKPRTGRIVLSAEQEGDHILLSITDDGAGMDPNKLRQIAVEKGLFDSDAAQRLSDTEAFNLIFAPGFSTKKEISDVSGRGVGMDVVKTKINQLNGAVEIESTLGEGSRLNIKVPLTLAIMPTLMIMLGKQTFALPLASVNEIFYMDLRKAHVVDGQECVTIRNRAIPIFHLKHWLVKGAVPDEQNAHAHVVIVTVGTQLLGFVVDQLIGQEEVVIKPLGKMLQGTPGMAGATITGDGTIALILDVPGLLKRYARSSNKIWSHR